MIVTGNYVRRSCNIRALVRNLVNHSHRLDGGFAPAMSSMFIPSHCHGLLHQRASQIQKLPYSHSLNRDMAKNFRGMWKPLVKEYDLPDVVVPSYIEVMHNMELPKFALVVGDSAEEEMNSAY